MKSDIVTINLNGGYGRCIAATGAISKFALKHKDKKINVITGYPEVLINNPHINKVYNLNHEYLYEDHIEGTEYLEPEPYKLQGYIAGKQHMVNGFNQELNGVDEFVQPEIYLTKDELEEAKTFISQQEKKVILFQPWGALGGMTPDGKKILTDKSFRSLPTEWAKKLHDALIEEGFYVVTIRAPNQAAFENSIVLPPMPLRKIIGLIPFVHTVICVDSALQHACGALKIPSIVFWGSTNRKQLGYETNLDFGNLGHKIQYNPVRMPGNDYDVEKRYRNVWNYLSDGVVKKVVDIIKNKKEVENVRNSK